MPRRRWGIPDEIWWLVAVMGLAVGPVFLVAGFTVVEQAAWSGYSYWAGQTPSLPQPAPPASPGAAVHFEIDVEGDGQVTYSPPGTVCASGHRCATDLPRHSRLTLIAAPSVPAWQGDCIELGTQLFGSLVMDRDKSCVVRFAAVGSPPVFAPSRATATPRPASPTPSPTVTPVPTPTSVTVGPRAELKPQDCGLESTSRSTDGSTVTSVEFTNSSTRPVRIYWLNYSGQRQLYRTLPTTAHYVQSTWVTHPLVVTDLEGRCLAIYMATGQPGSATLK